VLDAEPLRVCHQDAKHDRVQVQMQMAVDVVEGRPVARNFSNCALNFGPELLLEAALEKITKNRWHGIFRKFTARVDEAGNFFRWQRGVSAQQREMQADAKFLDFPLPA